VETEKFESWAIVELFGHAQIAGKVTEATIGGSSLIRVDVPECNGQKAYTKFYGNGAIYSMTPCSEEVARAALKQIMPEPVSVWIPELKRIEAPNKTGFKEFDDE
jgi:hypothetical protein